MVPKNKAKRANSANVLYYIIKLKKIIKYQQATKKQKAILLIVEKQAVINKR